MRAGAAALALALLFFANAAPSPDFSGVWKLQSPRLHYSEVWTITQSGNAIHIRMVIQDDQLGDRTLDFQAALDGKEHRQTVIGTPASVKAAWLGDALSLEIKRQVRPDLLLHNKRILRFANDGKRIHSQTTRLSPPPPHDRTEIFEKQ